MKKYYIAVIIPFLFSNFLCSVPKSFHPQNFENLDVTNPETLAQVAQMLNLQETLLKDDGLFNPELNKEVKGHSGNYKVCELRDTEDRKNKTDSIKTVLGNSASITDVNNKTVYTYQYRSYQARKEYPEVTGNFDGVKDTANNKLHIKGRVDIKLSGGDKTLRLYLGNSGREPLDSVVIDSSNKATGGKISLSFSGSDGSDRKVQTYDLSSLKDDTRAMINQLGFLNI